MKNKKDRIFFKNSFLILLLFLSIATILKIELKAQSFSLFIDLKPIFLSLDSGGPGIGLGWEYYFNKKFSTFGKFVYMNFLDVGIWLIYYLQGFRFYFCNSNFDKFFFGLYGIVLYGSVEQSVSLVYGFQIDIGYKWRIEGFERYFIEPQIIYIYIVGEPLLFGLSMGLNIGIIF